MMHSLLGLALQVSAPAAIPARQPTDVRCFIVAAEMADSKDKEVETSGTIMLFYYLGRLDGSNPGANLEQLITREAEQMQENDKKELLTACAAKVEKRGNDLSAMAD